MSVPLFLLVDLIANALTIYNHMPGVHKFLTKTTVKPAAQISFTSPCVCICEQQKI